MNKLIIRCICSIFIFYSCNNAPPSTKIDTKNKSTINGFVLKGRLTNYLSNKVYLNKIIENSIYPVDSAIIENNQFIFNGSVHYPERFQLTFENYSTPIVFILENTPIEIEIDPKNIQEPIIKGSPLNSLLAEYKQHSKSIFHKIDLLFPEFQKARLENNAEKLTEIGNKLKVVETEFRDYSFLFIKENKDSYVAAMILRDQLKLSTIDTLKIKESYTLLSEKVKKSPDAQLIELSLNY